MAKIDVKKLSKNIPIKYFYIAVALVVVVGAFAFYRGGSVSPPDGVLLSTYVCGGSPIQTSDKFTVLSCTPPQLSQDALTQNYYFIGKIKINNTANVPLTRYSVAYIFHTSQHGDITLTQARYFGPAEFYEFEFQTPSTMLLTETATAGYKVNIG